MKKQRQYKKKLPRSYKAKTIFMIGVFMKPEEGKDDFEMHTISWHKKLRDAERYLGLAGRLVPKSPGNHWEDPFEYRWTHAVIEEVQEGRFPTPIVKSWWEATFKDGNVSATKISEPPEWFPTEGIFGFTFPG